MKTALLAQNEALAARDYLPQHDMSVLSLSHSVQYPVDVDGAILPCCCIEVSPHESYLISNEILLRQLQPLKVPQMTRYTLVTAYYYCSNRLGWKKWSMFANQADKGRPDINYSFELPKCCNFTFYDSESNLKSVLFDKMDKITDSGQDYPHNINYLNTLHTYFDISMNRKAGNITKSDLDSIDDNDDLPLAFPFFDYQMICRDFYTNIDRIPDTPSGDWFNYDNPFSDWAFSNLFPVDYDEIRLKDGIQAASGFNSGDDESVNLKGFQLDKVRYHDLRPDYFTSSKRAPMRGEAPTVDTTIAVSRVDASEVFAKPNEVGNMPVAGYGIGIQPQGETHIPEWDNKLVAGQFKNSTTADSTYIQGNSELNQYAKSALENLKVDLTVSKSITCAQIMLMTQLTLWKTLNMLSKPTYNDFLNAHFGGVKVGDSLAEAPQYIGGTSQVIDVNEVLQTSADSGTQKLGNQAAVAHSYSSSNVGKFFAQDFGFIIGVMFIIPDIVYRPAMPRWASRRTIEEYYFPEFANLSMQATLNKELFYSNDKDWNNQALGYVGAYDELRSIPNYCAGLMLDDEGHSDLTKWLVTRKFSNDNKPAINQRFLSCKGNVDKEAWTVPNEPKFMFQCANYVKAAREMPWIAIPKLS